MSAAGAALGDKLAAALGEGGAVYADPVDLLGYQRDTSLVRPGTARVVVRPSGAADVATVLATAAAEGAAVYVRGGGTMYAGGANPHAGGVVLDMSGMDRILDIDLARGVVVCEPGVRFGALSKALAPHGMTVGVIPVTAPAATVGGAASAHALGTGSARFQSFADEVVGLEVVLADGRVLSTGSALAGDCGFFQRYATGPDLTGLFLGADASLGVITRIALWLHPLPERRETRSFGFPGAAAAAAFVDGLQRTELTRDIWYGAGYEGATVSGRVMNAFPDTDPGSLPGFCVGLDFGGDAAAVGTAIERAGALAEDAGGSEYAPFDQAYFRRLRNEEIYWYSFAGYFSLSRCAILMTSLPTERLADFIGLVEASRADYPDITWGGAVVVCRRGLHGGVIGFYDEASQWAQAEEAVAALAPRLLAAGCIPYKSGKVWADSVRGFTPYHAVLGEVKQALDPRGVLAPGNLGLNATQR